MTQAAALIGVLRERGVVLVVAGDRLRFRPRESVSPEEVAQLVALKTEIISCLSAEEMVEAALDIFTVNGERPKVVETW